MKAIFPTIAVVLATTALVSAQDKGHKAAAAAQPAAKPAESAPETAPPVVAGDEPAQIAATFFGLLQKSRVEEAYTNLTKGSKIAEKPDELRSLKAKTSQAIEMFGSVQGYDLVESKSVGAHLIRRTYLSLGKDFPLRWRFYFYRSDNVWRLVDLRVDDRLTGIFDETEPTTETETKQ